jgi:hypothetical protein
MHLANVTSSWIQDLLEDQLAKLEGWPHPPEQQDRSCPQQPSVEPVNPPEHEDLGDNGIGWDPTFNPVEEGLRNLRAFGESEEELTDLEREAKIWLYKNSPEAG